MKRIKISENHFDLHPSGAIYWLEKKTLMLADVHLGKVAHFRKNTLDLSEKYLPIIGKNTCLVQKNTFAFPLE